MNIGVVALSKTNLGSGINKKKWDKRYKSKTNPLK